MAKASMARQNIMTHALALFRERGFDQVSIADICEAAGCSISTFYYQFDSKIALVGELFSRKQVLNDERIAQILACASPWEQLLLIHESFMLPHSQMGLNLSIRVIEFVLNDEHVFGDSKDNVYMCNLVVPIIKRGQELGEIRNPSPAEDIMKAVWVMLNGIAYSWAADQGTYDITEKLRSVLEVLYDIRPDLRQCVPLTE